MPRITCSQPSTGKPINVALSDLGTAWTTIAEAPDFSVPDPSQQAYAVRDPLDASRGIAVGEVFFLTPLLARNLAGASRWIEVRLLLENGTENDAMGRFIVPAGETVSIPMQGRSLVKRNAAGSNGDRLQVRAEAAASFDVWAAANEQAAAEHVGVV